MNPGNQIALLSLEVACKADDPLLLGGSSFLFIAACDVRLTSSPFVPSFPGFTS